MHFIQFNPYTMKKILLLSISTFLMLIVNGQTAIPNGSFELWKTGNFDLPQNYPVSSNPSTFYRIPTAFNVTKTAPGFHGSNAVELTTTISSNSDTVFAYMVPVQPNGDPTSWHGGIPYDQMATGLRGYYKYNIATADSGTVLVAFSKAGVNIGTYVYALGGIHSDYTLFDFKFLPALSTTPDSVIFAAISCKFTAATQQPVASAEGSLVLDSISFTGVTGQPASFNGDFENWNNYTVALPNSWNYNGNDQGDGIYRSTDPEAGTYALELKTYLENGNNGNQARAGEISNSYQDQSCKCQRGGIPFANQTDTLAFYYKYTAAGNDSAAVTVNIKKNGSFIWGSNVFLTSSATYQYKEIYIQTGQVPDTAIINIQSSANNNPDMLNVGSDLIIDDLHFKATPVNNGILNRTFSNKISIYPNPSQGILKIQDTGFKLQSLEIYNIQGTRVYSSANFKTSALNQIDLSTFEKGIYFVKMVGAEKNQTEKIVIQ